VPCAAERAHRVDRGDIRKVLPRIDVGEPASDLLDLDPVDVCGEREAHRLWGRIDRGHTSAKQENQEEDCAEAGNHGNPEARYEFTGANRELYRTCASPAEPDKIRRFLPAEFPQSHLQ